MCHLLKGKHIAFIVVALTLVTGVMGGVVHAAAPQARSGLRSGAGNSNSFCARVGKTIWVSSGAMMYCFGPQPNGPPPSNHKHQNNFGSNVNAASPSEDIAPNGTRAYGQSEVSTAAVGTNVVEAWNDSTFFFSPPCSPGNKDQGTGLGFSKDGGKTFADQGGLPNVDCATSAWSGDPSVEAWAPGGTPYFYVSSLLSGTVGSNFGLLVALTACKGGATLSCNSTPTVLADFPGSFNSQDKDFMSIDPVRGILYVSFTDFNGPTGDDIALWACDIASNPGSPVCHGPLYVASSNGCENEGAYPAVDLASGDVYVAYEHNWATNLTNFGSCATDPVQERLNQVSGTCASPVATFPNGCVAPFTEADVSITSMDSAFIPGYNRFPMNDFPRIAVSDPFGTVSIIWNDARFTPAGDILLQSFGTGTTFPIPVQSLPVRVNSSTGGWHMLPALRNTDDDGDLQISFYGRASANTDVTNVYAAIDVAPNTTAIPGNVKVTTAPSAWLSVSSDIIPNFGDYTDNYVIATPGAPYTQQTLYVAWSDGRLGDPQPFSAHSHTN